MISTKSYCYYTPIELANSIIKLIPSNNIKSIIDINCGNGALLKAAQLCFPNAELFGVDINNQSFHNSIYNCSFTCADGLIYVKNCDRKYDLILSNPPFGMYESNDNNWVLDELCRKRYECIMLNANLSLMHNESWLIIILPSTFINGDSYRKIRIALSEKYGIHSLVLLPEDTFGSHYIKTYALILHNKRENSNPTIIFHASKYGSEWDIIKDKEIASTSIAKGNWYKEEKKLGIRHNFEIFRGLISSSSFSKTGIPIYHTSIKKNNRIWKPSIRYVANIDKKQNRIALKGDIIINRIGKSSGYWWKNNEIEYPVSDCLLVLRGLDSDVEILESVSTNGRLNIEIHGLSTKFVTQGDIISLIGSVVEKERECKYANY